MYKFVVTRCGSGRQQGCEGHGKEGGRGRGGEQDSGLEMMRKIQEESFNCPIGSECNR